jgi:hypothetical protein
VSKKKNKTESEVTINIVRTLALQIIDQLIPGKTWKCKMGQKSRPVKLLKSRIIMVLDKILEETKGFTIPLVVNFCHGEAAAIGFLLGGATFAPRLSNDLHDLYKKGISVPSVAGGWHNGAESCYIMISDIRHEKGIQGFNLDGVTVIDIHDGIIPQRRILLLQDIVS